MKQSFFANLHDFLRCAHQTQIVLERGDHVLLVDSSSDLRFWDLQRVLPQTCALSNPDSPTASSPDSPALGVWFKSQFQEVGPFGPDTGAGSPERSHLVLRVPEVAFTLTWPDPLAREIAAGLRWRLMANWSISAKEMERHLIVIATNLFQAWNTDKVDKVLMHINHTTYL
ncbi:unnamed protein product [Protopolystoma xenopodis]|uniref:Uncharacterized protein n=1 Tax=Protopolystoma xenopodis TaxID=117903 RepID=A0A3S5A3S6_9PLAT|nr:unnamed protein product [Protopolystoma xenopodis]